MENRPDVTRSTNVTVSAFASSREHLLAELERIDLLITCVQATSSFEVSIFPRRKSTCCSGSRLGSPAGPEPGRRISSTERRPSTRSAV